ncbi:MAG: M23 family metallopeptidase [Bacteroidales bacterium]|nr:M23 family metallopeptidase [Bacteroidales bacterium]
MSKKFKNLKKRLSKRYRFVIVNDTTHENLFRVKATGIRVIVLATLFITLLCAMIFSIIAYTPLKQILPGYPSYQTQRAAVDNATKVDSLETKIRVMTIQLTNIQRIIKGQTPLPIDSLLNIGKVEQAEKLLSGGNYADSLLRHKVDSIERYNLSNNRTIEQIEGMLFFTPTKGVITQGFDPGAGHPYVDIAIKDGSAVCSVLDGTIIAAYRTDETGYNIQIQHANDLVSVYKHNTKLLKKVGDKVSAGTTISLAGNAGSLSTGPHLHFELWHKGEPVDPNLYINF